MYPQSLKKNRLKIRGFMVKTLTCGRLLGQPLYLPIRTFIFQNLAIYDIRSYFHASMSSQFIDRLAINGLVILNTVIGNLLAHADQLIDTKLTFPAPRPSSSPDIMRI